MPARRLLEQRPERQIRLPAEPRAHGREHVLDLGGGSGAYSINAVKTYPNLTAVVLDLPPVVVVTREYLAANGVSTRGLQAQITDGGSQAMELALLGICGPAGNGERPLLVIDPTYTNYESMAERIGRSTVSITRTW